MNWELGTVMRSNTGGDGMATFLRGSTFRSPVLRANPWHTGSGQTGTGGDGQPVIWTRVEEGSLDAFDDWPGVGLDEISVTVDRSREFVGVVALVFDEGLRLVYISRAVEALLMKCVFTSHRVVRRFKPLLEMNLVAALREFRKEVANVVLKSENLTFARVTHEAAESVNGGGDLVVWVMFVWSVSNEARPREITAYED